MTTPHYRNIFPTQSRSCSRNPKIVVLLKTLKTLKTLKNQCIQIFTKFHTLIGQYNPLGITFFYSLFRVRFPIPTQDIEHRYHMQNPKQNRAHPAPLTKAKQVNFWTHVLGPLNPLVQDMFRAIIS